MQFAVFCLFLLVRAVAAEPTCALDRHLNDCGYFGITQAECESRDCCWSPSPVSGDPWCFYKNGGYEYFNPALDRIDCGRFGVLPFECRSFGCMYAPTLFGPWCFYPNTNTDPSLCNVERVECGYEGIDQDECEGRGCCWMPLQQGSAEPWCFHSTASMPQPASVEPPSVAPAVTPESSEVEVSAPPPLATPPAVTPESSEVEVSAPPPAAAVATTLSEDSSGAAVEPKEGPGEDVGEIEEGPMASESGVSQEKTDAQEEADAAELERGLTLMETGSSGAAVNGQNELSADHSRGGKPGRGAWAWEIVSRIFMLLSRKNRKNVRAVDLYPCYPGRNAEECEQNPKCFWLTRAGESPKCVTRHRNQGVGWFGRVYRMQH